MYSNVGINKNKYIKNLSKRVKKANPNARAYYSYTYKFDDLDDKYYDMMRKKYAEFYKGFLDDDSMNSYYEKKRSKCCDKNTLINKKKSTLSSEGEHKGESICDCIEEKCECIHESYDDMKNDMKDNYENVKDNMIDGYENMKESAYNISDRMLDCCDSLSDCMDECGGNITDCMDDCGDAISSCIDEYYSDEEAMDTTRKVIMISLGVAAGIALVGYLMKRKW